MRSKTNLHSSHCREIWPSFESGHLDVHLTRGSKLRVPLTYLLLREASSLGACGKLAYLFSRSQGIFSHLEMIWGAERFPRVSVLKLGSSRLERGGSGNLWSFLKEVSHLSCKMWNAGWLWSQCTGIGLHLKLISGTPSYFMFRR